MWLDFIPNTTISDENVKMLEVNLLSALGTKMRHYCVPLESLV